ncbi:hypothetical protein B0H16DRAFT_1881254 [Mycena metata]|uniref:Uncharacterized protein n=1 Tax=Mycena metata TaxID=1033252 RepID=A0AAD7JTP7_9AGAR|nr:hypothetical protein B0H16DRAFT_1881254 [Mycena metata]
MASLQLFQTAPGVWTCSLVHSEEDEEEKRVATEEAQEHADWKTIAEWDTLWTSIRASNSLPSDPIEAALYTSRVLQSELLERNAGESARRIARITSMMDIDEYMTVEESRLPITAVCVAILCASEAPHIAMSSLFYTHEILAETEIHVTLSPAEIDALLLLFAQQLNNIYRLHPMLRRELWVDQDHDLQQRMQALQVHMEQRQDKVEGEPSVPATTNMTSTYHPTAQVIPNRDEP